MNNTCLNSKKFYEITFVGLLGLTFLIWGADVLFNGISTNFFNLFFKRGTDFLADFVNVIGYSSQKDPYNNTMYMDVSEKSYPPIVYALAYLFSLLVDMNPYYKANRFLEMYAQPIILMAFIISILVIFILTYEIIKRYKSGSFAVKFAIAVSLLISGPMMFTIERGNVIIVEPLLISFFIFNYDSKNAFKKEFALIGLALASAFKMTPAFFGCLLLFNKQWKDSVRAIVYGVLAFFLPFIFIKGTFANVPLMIRNLSLLIKKYSLAKGSSIRNIVYSISRILNIPYSLNFCLWLSAILTVLLLLYCLRANKKWEIVLAITLIVVCMTNYSAYYCNIYFIPCVICFLNEKEHDKTDVFVLLAFVFIFSPLKSDTSILPLYLIGNAILLIVVICKAFKEIIKLIRRKNNYNEECENYS